MEPNPNKIKKPERIVILADADQRKARVRQNSEEESDPATAAAQAEEAVTLELPPDEAATDRLGEQLGEFFMRGAVAGEQELEVEADVDLDKVAAAPRITELAFGEEVTPEEVVAKEDGTSPESQHK